MSRLDWFSTGILATGLPLALQDFGPWIGTYIVFFLGLFVVPRYVRPHRQNTIKLGAIGLGTVVFLYANYGGAVAVLPQPEAILGPVATIELADETIAQLLRMVNSIIVGPILIGVFAMTMNHILTRPEIADIRFVRHALPRRDPDLVVWTSAAAGTLFYLLFVAAFTGDLLVVP